MSQKKLPSKWYKETRKRKYGKGAKRVRRCDQFKDGSRRRGVRMA